MQGTLIVRNGDFLKNLFEVRGAKVDVKNTWAISRQEGKARIYC